MDKRGIPVGENHQPCNMIVSQVNRKVKTKKGKTKKGKSTNPAHPSLDGRGGGEGEIKRCGFATADDCAKFLFCSADCAL